MPRDISSAQLTALQNPVTRPVVFVELLLDDGATPVRLHSATGSLPFNGNTYIGTGDLGQIDRIEERSDLEPTRLRMGLSGLDSTLLAEAKDANHYGAAVTVSVVLYDSNNDPVDSAGFEEWSGFVETMRIRYADGEGSIVLTAVDSSVLWDRASGLRWNDEDQQRLFPGDLGFQYVHEQEDASFTWGGEAAPRDAIHRITRRENRFGLNRWRDY